MAHAIFDGHPLDEYLQNLGEVETPMPGQYVTEEQPNTLLAFILSGIHALRPSPLAERFKYAVISSTLLSEDVTSPTASMSTSIMSAQATYTHRSPALYSTVLLFSCILAWWRPKGWIALVLIGFGSLELWFSTRLALQNRASPETKALSALTSLIQAAVSWDTTMSSVLTTLSSKLNPKAELLKVLFEAIQASGNHSTSARRLLLPLTQPEEAAQLTGMYAPPSPRTRPWSVPLVANRSGDKSPTKDLSRLSKRQTWSGTRGTRGSTRLLFDPPAESSDEDENDTHPDLAELRSGDHFGAAALRFQPRGKKPRSQLASPNKDHIPTFSTGSRYTDLPPRSPRKRHSQLQSSTPSSPVKQDKALNTSAIQPKGPSLQAIQAVLRSALSARRYACAHLLALRFQPSIYDTDVEREEYWTNVHDVISLMTDAYNSATLSVEKCLETSYALEREEEQSDSGEIESNVMLSVVEPVLKTTPFSGFAPTPTPIAKFAAHMTNLSTALEEAREHLTACVSGLRPKEDKAQALLAYDAVRRELGVALREYERGRIHLIAILSPPQTEPEHEDVQTIMSTPFNELPILVPDDEVPSLGHSPSSSWPSPVFSSAPYPDLVEVLVEEREPMDEIEQVYSGDSEVGAFTRERSKMSREERIAAAKATRLVPQQPSALDRERWGPGGEVVQELKEMISRVAERKQKLANRCDSNAEEMKISA